MPKKWLIRFLIIDLFLIGTHLLWGDQVDALNLDYERTIPAYYSGLKLVIISSLFFLIFKLASSKKEKITYFLLSAVFVMLAFDEISELHENLGEYFLGVFNNYNLFNQESFMWLVFLKPNYYWCFKFAQLLSVFYSSSPGFLFCLNRANRFFLSNRDGVCRWPDYSQTSSCV